MNSWIELTSDRWLYRPCNASGQEHWSNSLPCPPYHRRREPHIQRDGWIQDLLRLWSSCDGAYGHRGDSFLKWGRPSAVCRARSILDWIIIKAKSKRYKITAENHRHHYAFVIVIFVALVNKIIFWIDCITQTQFCQYNITK